MIPAHLVRKVQAIELRSRKRVRTPRAGVHASAVRGAGFEFEQHRPYRPGDDVRRIDWNATARVGVPFVREARAERDLQMVLAVDLTPSMQFGAVGRSKHEALVLTTASLLFAALGDRISSGVLGFTNRVLDWSAPVADPGAAWTALRRVWDARPDGAPVRLQPLVRYLLETLQRTTLVFLVSDFDGDEDLTGSPELAVLAGRHDVVAIVLEDPAELKLPEGSGFVRVRDVETRVEVVVPLNDATRARYLTQVQQRRRMLQATFYRTGIDHVFVNTQRDVLAPVLALFAGRSV